ncbi:MULTISPECIES: hypothetical protein [Bacillus cereus group]|uniref:hypothetical protein n=1 Tax=Bacillus cereus group TaxID=86661 RepID=UPI0011A2E885|nr:MULTISPECIES: hypothetical protein [Bacillus cereus group]MDF9638813.1 hypothetical protein [Bacillus cereus]
MTKLNRGDLLSKAIKGEIKEGDQFKKNNGEIVRFDGTRFRWSDRTIMQLNVMADESFEPYVEEITVKLTQKEINSIRTLIGDESIFGLKRKKDNYSHPFEIIEEGEAYNKMFEKLNKLVK